MVVSGTVEETLPLTILCGIATLLLGFICSYAYPLTAFFENTVLQTLKNAMLLPLFNPLLSIIVTLLNLLTLLLFLLATQVFFPDLHRLDRHWICRHSLYQLQAAGAVFLPVYTG